MDTHIARTDLFQQILYKLTGAERARKLSLIHLTFCVTLAILNILSSKIGYFWMYFDISFSVGTVLYAVTFPCTDIVSELQGKETARRLVWRGFYINILIVIIIQIAIIIPAAPFYSAQEAYALVLGGTWRLILAGMISYLISQRFDVWFFEYAIERAVRQFKHKNDASLVTPATDAGSSEVTPFHTTPSLQTRVEDDQNQLFPPKKRPTDIETAEAILKLALLEAPEDSVSKDFWKRALITTCTSQLLDSIIFVHIGFLGAPGFDLTREAYLENLLPMVFTTWAVKAALTVPLLGVILGLRKWIGYSNPHELPDEVFLATKVFGEKV